MPTSRQTSLRMTVLSPSTVMHIADAEFLGNDVKVRTHCGFVPQNLKAWTRVYEALPDAVKCSKCFKEGE
jgi:hypothetical protein